MSLNNKPLPHSLEAEQSIIGGLLKAPELAAALCAEVNYQDFFDNDNQKLFFCIEKRVESNEPIDFVLLAEHFHSVFKYEAKSIFRYLHELFENVPSVANIFAYAKAVRERAAQRRLIGAAKDIQALVLDDIGQPVNEKIERAVQLIQQSETQSGQAHVQSLHDLVYEHMDELDRRLALGDTIDGIETGIIALDEKLRGLKPQQLIILAARPGAGKTAFALNIASHAALNQKKRVLFFSLEMSEGQLLDRLIASTGDYPLAEVKSGQVVNRFNLGAVAKTLQDAPISICGQPSLNMASVAAIARKQQYHQGLDLIVIDYLQLLGGEKSGEALYEKTSKISRAAKLLAKSLNVPVLMLSQLSRNNEGRHDKRPIAADLRDSGSIEQDADIILFIYREELYDKETPNKGTAEIIINKGRDIETGTVYAAWKGRCSRFDNLPEGYQPLEKNEAISDFKPIAKRYGSASDYQRAKARHSG